MSRFAENLAGLPTVDHLPAIRLLGPDGQAESILNQPGSQGSVRVYAYLVSRHGSLDAAAAAEGLVLYAEHTEDALIPPANIPISTGSWPSRPMAGHGRQNFRQSESRPRRSRSRG